MKKDQIGNNAKKIWQRLETNLTDTNIDKLKSDCNLDSVEFCIALGWLAKEDKINFIDYGETTYVFPVE